MLDLYTKKGDKVMVTRETIKAGGREWEEVAKKLRIGPQYTIAATEMTGGTRYVWIHEVSGVRFLAAHFSNLEKPRNIHFLSGREKSLS